MGASKDGLIMKNCFTTTYKYLSQKYVLPTSWRNWNEADMDSFVIEQKRFLARRDHLKFFKSFCHRVKVGQKDDVVLWDRGVGVCINKFAYWTYDHEVKAVITKKINKDCLLMRINHV